MARAKKSEEDKKVDSKKPVVEQKKADEKPVPKKPAPAPAPKKAVEKPAAKKQEPVVIEVGQRVKHVQKSHIVGEVISVRNSDEGFTLKMTVLCDSGCECVVSVVEVVVV